MENRMDATFYNSPVRPTAMPLRPVAMPLNGTIPLATLQQHQPVSNGRGLPFSTRPAPTAPPATASNSKRARKDRGPNWMQNEIFALIAAKRDMYFEEKDTVDVRDLMAPDSTKWMKISIEVMRAGFSPCVRDGAACKTKWNQILPDYKRISNYLGRTGRNASDYWDLSPTQRKEEGLPKHFPEDTFIAIDEWNHNRPQIQPPHVRDLLAPNDNNYRPQDQHQTKEDEDGNQDIDDPMDLAGAAAVHGTTGESTEQTSPPRSLLTLSSTLEAVGRPPMSTGTPVSTPLSRPRPTVPPGITPQIISSSDTSSYSLAKRPGNTTVKRKTVSGHTVIAEATKASGAVMAKQMQDIAECGRALERSKIEVQLQLFSEQMSYQREKDRRLYENALLANENARLSIMKQGDIVNCLSHLSNVLQKSLTKSNNSKMQSEKENNSDDMITEGPAHPSLPPVHLNRSNCMQHEVGRPASTGAAATLEDANIAGLLHSTGDQIQNDKNINKTP